MRRFRVAANWKMHKTAPQVREYFDAFTVEYDLAAQPERDVIFFASPILLPTVQECLKTHAPLAWGAQNIHWEAQGAFTGETSLAQCLDVGCGYVLAGHSERRTLFFESNEDVGKKVRAAMAQKLIPVLCVGETLKEREGGQTEAVLKDQLRVALQDVQLGEPGALIVAYEPVWAIGTGQVATVEQAQQAHKFIRQELAGILGSNGSQVSILYGGSVKAGNAQDLAAVDDIDGFLVGGASLSATEFSAICRVARP